MTLQVYAKRSLLIVTAFVFASIIPRIATLYFKDDNYQGIYKTGMAIGYTLLFVALLGSLVHSIHMIQQYRKHKEKILLLWLLIGLLPILYFFFGIVYVFITV